MYCIQHCIICRPSVSTVLEDAGIELRTVATPSHQSYLVGTETANELTPYIFLTQDWSGALAAKLPGAGTANELTPYIFPAQDWSAALAAKLPGAGAHPGSGRHYRM
jgi:hypothetical protein